MIFTKFLFLLSIFILWTGFNGLKAMGQDKLVKAMGQAEAREQAEALGQAEAREQAEALGQAEAMGQDNDLVGEDCGDLNDPTTGHQSQFCNTIVVFANQLLPSNGVLGYIPDCVYVQNIEEGKLMNPPENRNYDFEMANNEKDLRSFRVTKNYKNIKEGKIYLFTKVGNNVGERGLKMVKEINELVSGTTIIPCKGG
jgi:hypothetical protein